MAKPTAVLEVETGLTEYEDEVQERYESTLCHCCCCTGECAGVEQPEYPFYGPWELYGPYGVMGLIQAGL